MLFILTIARIRAILSLALNMNKLSHKTQKKEGFIMNEQYQVSNNVQASTQANLNNNAQIVCPYCGGNNVNVQVFQENAGSTTISKTKSKYKEKRHGILWWLLIGSWWWMVDIMLWIFLFPVKLIRSLTRKRKYKGKSKTVAQSVNHINYKTVYLCNTCGRTWTK